MTFTRRQVFQIGALAGLGRLVGIRHGHAKGQARLRAGTALWAGDATQTTVEITGYTGSVAATDLVGLRTALNPGMTEGVVDHPPAFHNASGFNKWSVRGLEPGRKYWHRLLVNGIPHGPVCRFRTLRPVGVPCTTTIAGPAP